MLSTDANVLSRGQGILMTYIRHSCTVTDHDIIAYMRGIAALLPAKYKFKPIRSMTGSWGTVATSTRKKQEGNASAETVASSK
ncbi:hypothetical protein OIU77_027055 [Salix suchowensis]|uniref:Uncharacterized protein n=1 Tax=Salix suchowensis TaxID=1278906 RepID=A0ABQ9BNA5_9ROSI|nr:hypothetical protein OIU77_027055 [Salix suchowensis]